MPKICYARLTKWEKTNETIGTANAKSSIAYMCKRSVKDGGFLCETCKTRPIEGKYQTRMVHGLVTDPFPEASHVYGSPWYWEKIALYGDPPQPWVYAAEEAQKEIEESVKVDGLIPWKVQRPTAKMLEGMATARKKKNSDVAKARHEKPAVPAVPVKTAGTLLGMFPEIRKMYQETDGAPISAKSFSSSITKTTWKDEEVWMTESGRIYSNNGIGKPGSLIGFTKAYLETMLEQMNVESSDDSHVKKLLKQTVPIVIKMAPEFKDLQVCFQTIETDTGDSLNDTVDALKEFIDSLTS
jgi:hypothetical protein